MGRSRLHLAPTPMLRLTPGTVTMGGEATEVTMVVTIDLTVMVTTERDLLMSLPLPSLDPTPMPRLTPGTGTTGMEDTGEDTEVTTDPMVIMVTMGRGLTVMPTGDKKWTSPTSNNIRSFPADSS